MHNLCKAIKQAQQACIDFNAFDDSLCQEIPEEVQEMGSALDTWEMDKSQPDPFKLLKASKLTFIIPLIKILILSIDISLSDAQLKLAKEEKAQIEAGNTSNYEIGATGMVLLGLEIKKLQYMYLSILYLLYMLIIYQTKYQNRNLRIL